MKDEGMRVGKGGGEDLGGEDGGRLRPGWKIDKLKKKKGRKSHPYFLPLQLKILETGSRGGTQWHNPCLASSMCKVLN